MTELLQSLLRYFADNWPEILWIGAAASLASYFAGRRARARWQKRDFLDRLNVSLNSIEDGTLRIRTVLEMDCIDIFLNATAAKEIVKLAKQTTPTDSLIPIPKADCWQYLNAVLNEISERFSAGQIKRDLGIPVQRGDYLLCLTCERAGEIRTQKIRAMLVRKSLLVDLPADEPAYESPNHVTRWNTLKELAYQYELCPHRFMDMEICL